MTGATDSTSLVVELLGKGIEQAKVARILSLHPSTVSEVATRYAQEIEESIICADLARIENDEIMDRIESKALAQLERCLPLETDPLKLTRIVTSLNQMSRRSRGERPLLPAGGTVNNINVVQLNVATALQSRHAMSSAVTLNNKNEVVAIGGITMAPASKEQIEARLQASQFLEPALLTPQEI